MKFQTTLQKKSSELVLYLYTYNTLYKYYYQKHKAEVNEAMGYLVPRRSGGGANNESPE